MIIFRHRRARGGCPSDGCPGIFLEIEIPGHGGIEPWPLTARSPLVNPRRRLLEDILELETGLSQNLQQLARENTVAAARAILRRLTGCRRIDDRGSLEARRHDGNVQPPCRGPRPSRQRIVPASIQNHDIERRSGPIHRIQEITRIDPFVTQILLDFDLRIGRDEKILAGRLNAVSRIEHQPNFGRAELALERRHGAAEIALARIYFQDDVEP